MSDLAVTATLCVLALVDAVFASWRTSTGRDGRLSTPRRELISAGWGLTAGLVCLATIALACAPALAAASTRQLEFDRLVDGGRRMLAVYGPLALLVVAAVGIHVVGGTHDRRAAAMTIVLGPVTLFRPLWIALGAVAAVWPDPDHLWLPAAAAVASTVSVGPALGWIRYRHLRWQRPVTTDGSAS